LADCEKLNLLLLVEVTAERAPLQSGGSIGTVPLGDELQVMRVNGKWLWVETVLASGDTVQGWIQDKHVR